MHLALLCHCLQLWQSMTALPWEEVNARMHRYSCAALGTAFLSVTLGIAVTSMVLQQQKSNEKSLGWGAICGGRKSFSNMK